jgi:hypothetical protein
MDPTEFPVYPNIKKTVTICKARIHIMEIKIFESVRVAVYLLDDRDSVVESTIYLIEGPEYEAWSNDDKYLVNLVRQKIQQQFNATI